MILFHKKINIKKRFNMLKIGFFMLLTIGRKINKFLSPLNIKIQYLDAFDKEPYAIEATPSDIEIIKYVRGTNNPNGKLTKCNVKRIWAAISSVNHIIKNNIPGDIAECGVWRGGCSLAMALKLKELNSNKKIYLFDTFEGMTEPSVYDKKAYKKLNVFKKFNYSKKKNYNEWCYASLSDVKHQFNCFNLLDNVIFVKGDIRKTLLKSSNLPSKLSILRLDTDFHDSTESSLKNLFPLLEKNGILLIDDYGCWEGVRKAVDEYFQKNLSYKPMLWMTDYSERIFIKQ